MNKKMILKIISKIVMMEGILLLLPSIVGLYYNEYRDAKIYLFMSVITATLFYILSKISVKNTNIYAKDGLICTALIWIIWSLVGALPFYIAGYIPNYFDAFLKLFLALLQQGQLYYQILKVFLSLCYFGGLLLTG